MRSKLFFITLVLFLNKLTYGDISFMSTDPLLNKSVLSSFEKLISRQQIEEKIEILARQIDEDAKGEELTMIMVLKGGLLIGADLIRKIKSPCVLECIQTSSYGKQGTHRGKLKIHGLDKLEITGKNVLIVDDIFDSGATLSTLVEKISALNPKKLRSAVLLLKKTEHVTDYRPDYVLFEIENRFVVGFGLDYKEYWRGLSDIFAVQ
jgi:hypoxanthine phosphoribosyltransferase